MATLLSNEYIKSSNNCQRLHVRKGLEVRDELTRALVRETIPLPYWLKEFKPGFVGRLRS